jgi:hypothetical protein
VLLIVCSRRFKWNRGSTQQIIEPEVDTQQQESSIAHNLTTILAPPFFYQGSTF